jgi:regulator of sigma E protease
MLHILLVAVVLILMIFALVAAHELGHYLTAKWTGMEVEEFCIGMGKRSIQWMQKDETKFTVRAWPVGGFARIKGMEPQEDGGEVNTPGGFYNKSPLARLFVLFGGPLFSIVFGVILLAIIYTAVGTDSISKKPIIGTVVQNSASAKAGLVAGDQIVSINRKSIHSYYEVILAVRDLPGETLPLEYLRKGKRYRTQITPIKDKEPTPVINPDFSLQKEKKIQGKIGIAPFMEKVPMPFGESTKAALAAPLKMGQELLALFLKPATIKDNVGGIGTIAMVTATAVDQGIYKIVTLGAILSISLGFMNLLPIPPLDGGQMVIAFIELCRKGKRLSLKTQQAVASVGFFIMMLLIAGVLWIDAKRIISGDFPTQGKQKSVEQKAK